MVNEVICGDAVTELLRLPSASVDFILTSPPYDNLRKYNGYDFDASKLAPELFRVLKPGGMMVWVVSDQTINGSESGTSFKQALMFKEHGFKLYDTMIYAKKNPVPLTHRRYEQCFEYMFAFCKGKKPRVFNAIMVDVKNPGGTKIPSKIKANEDSYSYRQRDEVITYGEHKIAPNIFYYAVGSSRETGSHNAPFPEDLARDQILSWTNPGDLVLDPMCGSGTTLKVAKNLNRNYVGIDISSEYCSISMERIRNVKTEI